MSCHETNRTSESKEYTRKVKIADCVLLDLFVNSKIISNIAYAS